MGSLLILLGIKAGLATGLYKLCVKWSGAIDAHYDEADKEKFALALRSGAWMKYLQIAYDRLGSSLDRWLGQKIFSWRMLLWSLIISIIANFALLAHSIFFQNFDRHQVYSLLETRLPIALLLDFITLIRVRYFCKNLMRTNVLRRLLLSMVLDAASLVALTALYVEAVLFSIDFDFALHNQAYGIEDAITTFKLDPSDDVLFICPAMAPALLFYPYTFSLFLLKVITGIARPFAALSSHIHFKKPFVVVGEIAGGVLALLVMLSGWVWNHI